MKICNNCEQELPDDSIFCFKCGTKYDDKLVCPKCGIQNINNANFCLHCGQKLRSEVDNHFASDNANCKKTEKENEVPYVSLEEQKSMELQQTANFTEKPEYFYSQFESILNGKKGNFNWAAFFLSYTYPFYRKCKGITWKYFKTFAVLYALSIFLLCGYCISAVNDVSVLITGTPVMLLFAGLTMITYYVCSVIFALNFNREYYLYCSSQDSVSNEGVTSFGRWLGGTLSITVAVSLISFLPVFAAVNSMDDFGISEYYPDQDTEYYDEQVDNQGEEKSQALTQNVNKALSADDIHQIFRKQCNYYGENELVFECFDYDNDGSLEAFGVTEGYDEWNSEGKMFFVNSEGDVVEVFSDKNGGWYGYLQGIINVGSEYFFVWEHCAGGSGSESHILGVENNTFYEPNISDQYGCVTCENGVVSGVVSDFSQGFHDYIRYSFNYDKSKHEFQIAECLGSDYL